jgi:DHA2 family multidrug resistance protein-like MFS transporter
LLVGVSNSLAILVTASVVVSLAFSPMFNLTTELVVGSAPPERAGAASGISETGAELGAALGISILGSIGTAVYRSGLSGGLPAGIPPEAAEAARDTLGGAVSVAAQLPGELGAALLHAARGAFVQGLHLVAVISIAIALAAAIVAVLVFRRLPASSQHQGEADPTAANATVIEFDNQEAENAA